MKKRYGENIQLLFTDTDSLMYEIQTEDYYRDMLEMKQHFDLANYPRTSQFYDGTNNKVVGKFKDEANGDPIIEFVGLRPKMYSYQTLSERADGSSQTVTKKRAKGLQRAAVSKMHHEEFKAQLEHPVENYVVNRRFGSKLHVIYGIEVNPNSDHYCYL